MVRCRKHGRVPVGRGRDATTPVVDASMKGHAAEIRGRNTTRWRCILVVKVGEEGRDALYACCAAATADSVITMAMAKVLVFN